MFGPKTRPLLFVALCALPLGACVSGNQLQQNHMTLSDLAVAGTACGGGIIDFDVRNNGRATARYFSVIVRDPGGAVVDRWAVNVLRGGDQRNYRFIAQAGTNYSIDVDPENHVGDPNRGDNTRVARCGGGIWNGTGNMAQRPDLMVIGAQCRGDRVRFQVRNQGAPAQVFNVVVQGPEGRTSQTWDVPGLAHGALRSFTYTRHQSGSFRITVDPFSHVDDDVRANNEAQITCDNAVGVHEVDLAVVGATCLGGDIRARVANKGRARVGSVEMVLKTNLGRIVGTRTLPDILPGRVVEIALHGKTGQRYILELDPASFITDTYRGNNKKVVRCGN